MKIRNEQIIHRFKNLFPLNAPKDDLKSFLDYLNTNSIDTKRVLVKSSKLNYKMAYFGLLMKYISKVDKLPTLDFINTYQIVEIYFTNTSGDLPYHDLSSFDTDILGINIGLSDPNSKKSTELVQYLMYDYERFSKSLWLFVKGDNKDVLTLAKELNYTIIDLDSIVPNKKPSTKQSTKTYSMSNVDIF